MAEDSVFDSGLSGILGETSGSRRSAEWEENLLGSLSDGELAEFMSEPAGGSVRVAFSDPNGEGNARHVKGRNVADDISAIAEEMERAEQESWGARDAEIGAFVTARLYDGHSPKQIQGLLRLMHPAARVEAFFASSGSEVMSRYGRLGFLYVDASDFRDDAEMDGALGGQKKIGQMALESIKPAGRCGDCNLNRGGFCMRYNLALDGDPSVRNVRQARRIVNKFARSSEAYDRAAAAAQERLSAAESRRSGAAEYERIVSEFLTSVGQPRHARKGGTGRHRMPGLTDSANRPPTQHDAGVEALVRRKLADGCADFAGLRGAAMRETDAGRAKAWFRSNRALVSQLIEAAGRERSAAAAREGSERAMDGVRGALAARYGRQQADRLASACGPDPAKYAELLSRAPGAESRRIGAGRQTPRAMPSGGVCRRVIGRLDDELRSAAAAAAERGVPEGGLRACLAASLGERRVAAFEEDCPRALAEMASRAALGFGRADGDGLRLFEELLERQRGDVAAAVGELRRRLGRRRARLLLAEHPNAAAAVAASSRAHPSAAAIASDRRVGGTASAARSLRPEGPIDYDAIAREAAAAFRPEPEPPPHLPPPALDPTLVAGPDMGETAPAYVDAGRPSLPEPSL
jgi:hypothetical protein